MLNAHALFLSIAAKFEKTFKDTHSGYVMSNPAIEYRGRAFAYFKNDSMIIKMSNNSPELYGIRGFRQGKLMNRSQQHWYEIPAYYKSDWEEIGRAELLRI
ncbi:MAG: hypothetical protein AAGK97_13200, partial [Bacteroidota bacterium]